MNAFLSDKVLHHLRQLTFKIVNCINHIHTSSKLESINNYRSIVKDLVHPSGHIFFGEVAVKSEILSSGFDGRFEVNPENQMGIVSSTFVPTIIIPSFPTDNVLMEDSPTDGSGTNQSINRRCHLLENEDSRDNIAQTSKETIIMLYTTQAEVDAQDMITQLRNAQV